MASAVVTHDTDARIVAGIAPDGGPLPREPRESRARAATGRWGDRPHSRLYSGRERATASDGRRTAITGTAERATRGVSPAIGHPEPEAILPLPMPCPCR